MGHFPFNQKFRNLRNGNLQSNCQLNPRIIEFTEYQSFNREFREESNQSEILGIKFSNI